MVPFIIFFIALFAAGASVMMVQTERSNLSAMSETDTYAIEDLKKISAQFPKKVEIIGNIECETPTHADFSTEKCVYYHCEIEEEYEEWYKDSNGDSRSRTVREKTYDVEHSVPFKVNDGTGVIDVFPAGAHFIGVETDNYKGDSAGTFKSGLNTALDMAGVDYAVGERSGFFGNKRNFQGKTESETIIPLGIRIYILGEAVMSNGIMAIAMPADGSKFIVSMSSEEELTKSAQSNVNLYMNIMYVSIPVAVISGIIGVIQLMK